MSDKASDVADALSKRCEGAVILHEKAESITVSEGAATGVKTRSGEYFADSIILASGGKSYPLTGSDGSGYKLATAVGHHVTKTRPSLVPIVCDEKYPEAMGLTVKNCVLSLYSADKPKKTAWSELGELTFEDYGIGGPLALTASCLMDEEKLSCKGYMLYIDFKPALTEDRLDKRLQRKIAENPSGSLNDLMRKLLPGVLADIFAGLINPDGRLICGNMSREIRMNAVKLLKRFPLTPTAFRGFSEAIITRGGVDVKEINPGTMESKLVNGLYFTGEIIDVDGFTGGYNLTEAFSTAYTAAEDIINKRRSIHDN